MAKKVLLYCEKCKAEVEHWDNRLTKKGKQPDFKCCKKECGNGIWNNSKKKVEPKEVETKSKTYPPKTTNYGSANDNVPQSMYGRWAIDASLATLVKSLDKEEVMKTFDFFLAGIKRALNGELKAVSTSAETAVEDESQEESIEVDTDFDDLDI